MAPSRVKDVLKTHAARRSSQAKLSILNPMGVTDATLFMIKSAATVITELQMMEAVNARGSLSFGSVNLDPTAAAIYGTRVKARI